ncbi:MAG: hypothetical protein P1P65_08415, partial [Treponema sp.]
MPKRAAAWNRRRPRQAQKLTSMSIFGRRVSDDPDMDVSCIKQKRCFAKVPFAKLARQFTTRT